MTCSIDLKIINFLHDNADKKEGIIQALQRKAYPLDLPIKYRPKWWYEKSDRATKRRAMWCNLVLECIDGFSH